MAVVIVGLIGVVVWQYFTLTSSTHESSKSSIGAVKTTSGQDTSPKIPNGWKTYTNDNYKFSFSYPSDWKVVDLGMSELAPTSAATDKSAYSIGFQRPQDIQAYADFSIDVTHETLQQAIDSQKAIINQNYPDMAIKLVLTNEKKFSVSGYPAAKLDITDIPQASSIKGGNPGSSSYTSDIYVSAKSLLYKFTMGNYDTPDALKNSTIMQVFGTLQIK